MGIISGPHSEVGVIARLWKPPLKLQKQIKNQKQKANTNGYIQVLILEVGVNASLWMPTKTPR